MEDGKTNKGDTGGKEVVDDSKKDKKDSSELDKLKTHNDEIEKELIRGRELKTEIQKLEAEKMVGGRSDAGQSPEKKKVLSDKEYAEALERGEVNPMKEDGFT